MNTQRHGHISHITGNAPEHVTKCSGNRPTAWPPAWADPATGRAKDGSAASSPAPIPATGPPRDPVPKVIERPVPKPAMPTPVPEWSQELADFILGLTPTDLPPAPFRLHPWANVVDSNRYLAWLKRDVELGPRSPRAQYGVLHGDMERLQEVVSQYRKGAEP